MEFKGKLRNDKSGVSNLLIAVVIIIIIVVIAAAAYVVLSGDNNNNDTQTIGPGTVMKFDDVINGESSGVLEEHYIGQNADEYFIMEKLVNGSAITTQYTVSSKSDPDGAEITGTMDLDTIDGAKTLNIWEYTIDGGYSVKSYVDPSSGLTYKNEFTGTGYSETQTLKEYELVWQSSYEESDSIGTTYEYNLVIGGITSSTNINIKCVADCQNDQFGVLYDFTSIVPNGNVYFLSDTPQGLPTDATNTGTTTTLTGTIDGDVTVEIWAGTDSATGFSFYYEPNTHIIYKITMMSSITEIVFNLVSGP